MAEDSQIVQDVEAQLRGQGLEGEKEPSSEVIAASVRTSERATEEVPSDRLDSTLLWMVAQAADEISPWGLRPKQRDRQLRSFFPTESMFVSSLGIVAARNAAFSWQIEGEGATARETQEILDDANDGRGWADFVSKFSIDLYSQDHGAFIEIVRNGDGPEAPLWGINTLDADKCWHTGDPLKPVIYQDRKGDYHLMDWWNVVPVAELPVSHDRLPGIQICALSRLLLAVQIIKNIAIYKKEKTGGRHTRAIHLVQGMTGKAIEDALADMATKADQKGLLRYVNPLVVGSHDPKANIDIKTLEIAALPDGFSEEDTFKHYIAQIAMAFQSDYQEFAPLPGGNLGTSTQSEMLHLKSQGKGPALFMKILTRAMNRMILPKNVQFGFAEADIEAEKSRADISKVRAEERKARIESGEITEGEARQLAVDAGDLPVEIFEATGGIDVTREPVRDGDKPEAPKEGAGGELIREGEREVRPGYRPFWEGPWDEAEDRG